MTGGRAALLAVIGAAACGGTATDGGTMRGGAAGIFGGSAAGGDATTGGVTTGGVTTGGVTTGGVATGGVTCAAEATGAIVCARPSDFARGRRTGRARLDALRLERLAQLRQREFDVAKSPAQLLDVRRQGVTQPRESDKGHDGKNDDDEDEPEKDEGGKPSHVTSFCLPPTEAGTARGYRPTTARPRRRWAEAMRDARRA